MINRRAFLKKTGLLAAMAAIPAPLVDAIASQLPQAHALDLKGNNLLRHAVAMRTEDVRKHPALLVKAKRDLLDWAKWTCTKARRKPKKIEFSEQLWDFDHEYGVGIAVYLEEE